MRPYVVSLLSLALLGLPARPIEAQQRSGTRAQRDSVRRPSADSLTREQREAVREAARDARSISRRVQRGDSSTRAALTDAASTTAFATPEARAILVRARQAREVQDSALKSYRATTTQRMSVSMGARKLGLEKLLFRGDNVAEISWRRDVGVWVKPVGSRLTVPMASDVRGDMVSAVTIPYFPGREQLWFPSSDFGVAKTEVDDRDIIHPLARGAERWYRYETGDSVDIRLPNDRVIHLRELKITARKPEWRTFVGSFWFDRDGGQLVRAAYRMAAEIDIWSVASEETARELMEDKELAPVRDSVLRARLPREIYVKDSTRRAEAEKRRDPDEDDVPAWVSATFRPAKARLDAITVEYGLYQGKFWLPRAHSATASADFLFMRVPFRLDEKFTYESVDGDFALPALPAARNRFASGDSAKADTTGVDVGGSNATVTMSAGGSGNERTRQRRDSVQASVYGAAKVRQCANDTTWTRIENRYEGAVRVAYQLPCDMKQLSSSPVLPPESASDESLFDLRSQAELVKALGLSLQAPWAPQMPRIRLGSDLLRYNRVEGLSAGVEVSQTLGAGFTARAVGRIGHADLHANGEFALSRSNGARTVTATAYHRLAAMNPEWAGALTLGPSLPAFLYGRDEGFYYRTMGVSLREQREQRRGAVEYGLFLERQWTAGDSDVVNTFSLARALGNRRFRQNMVAEPGAYAGANMTLTRLLVERPRGLRLTSIMRAEAATGTFEYGRGSVESTISSPTGPVAVAVTGSIGSSVGRVPAQRTYMVGGLRTVRGQLPGTQGGDAYWFTRAEVGTRRGAVRPVAFFDVGWSGSRKTFGQIQPQRGTGIGLGLLDGLLRFDVSRGLYPFKGWRSDFYLEAPL
ncbi:MAG TPA: hypothetical protein DGD08_11755 [Gemmatimonas aurantiaca]|uniref:Uncharacterized protein n=2 Tax=Gemmatimonas aurantiaca TaxID=173480 RepID=C1AC98_GEMAT|nr:hypothetical protein [Gemmatimonas aurantiaca]BAH40125.1 hypothetical protein GAU_3083 [Gemmatimonas aurantiaca T-27]HCT57867.1 hypothetical protein [Gemmatimonas aurantiaca]